jgi:Na+/H+ antiporter NhaD/arsenite permease-like protein
MLIGETLRLPFAGYLLDGGPPAVIGLAVTWLILRMQWRARWDAAPGKAPTGSVDAVSFDRLQTMKGFVLLVAVVAAFLFTSWPRDVVALTAAGVLLLSRRMASREMVGLVDWHLLVLFVGLFVVNEAVERADLLHGVYAWLRTAGIDLQQPQWLFIVTPVCRTSCRMCRR